MLWVLFGHGSFGLDPYHLPKSCFNWGVVAKMDLAEVRGPFITAGLLTTCGALLVIPIGAIILVRASNPSMDRLEQVESFHRLPIWRHLCENIASPTMEGLRKMPLCR